MSSMTGRGPGRLPNYLNSYRSCIVWLDAGAGAGLWFVTARDAASGGAAWSLLHAYSLGPAEAPLLAM